MNLYDDVPGFKDEVKPQNSALPLQEAPKNDYDFVAPDQRDVESVKSDAGCSGTDDEEEDWEGMQGGGLDTVDGPAARGDVKVEVVPDEKGDRESTRQYVINDDETSSKGPCFWFFVAAIAFACLLFVAMLIIIIVGYVQMTNAKAPAIGNSTVRDCGLPPSITNGHFTPYQATYKNGQIVEYSCEDGSLAWNFTCVEGNWKGTMQKCTSEGSENSTAPRESPVNPATENPTTNNDATTSIAQDKITTSAYDPTAHYDVTASSFTTDNAATP